MNPKFRVIDVAIQALNGCVASKTANRTCRAYTEQINFPRRTEALSVVRQKVLLGFVSEESITPIRESEKDRRSTGILC